MNGRINNIPLTDDEIRAMFVSLWHYLHRVDTKDTKEKYRQDAMKLYRRIKREYW